MEVSPSPATSRLLERAQQIAASAGFAQTTQLEILAAILEDPDGQAVSLLKRANANLPLLQSALMLLFTSEPNTSESTPSESSLPGWSESAQSVLRRAQEIAVTYTRLEPMESQDVLVAILESCGELETIFRQCGVDPKALTAEFHQSREPPVIPVGEDLLDWNDQPPRDVIDVARIVDANLNRAREALRIIEEFARFVLDHRAISERLKHARHEVARIAAQLPPEWLLTARETQADVGTTLTTDRERHRADLSGVVSANMKRAQEALRVLEEYLKLHTQSGSAMARNLRYEVYTLEKILDVSTRSASRLEGALLYWLCDPWACQGSVEWTVREAVEGGVDIVQLRDKQSDDRERLALARRMREWTHELGALFICNDRPDLARLAQADGVHLGQEDLSIRDARRICGPEMLIGVSTHDMNQYRDAQSAGADYVGVGPVFPSKSKEFASYTGLDFVRAVADESLPTFAIGGIHEGNIEQVIQAGATRVAVCHAICSASDPKAVAGRLANCLK